MPQRREASIMLIAMTMLTLCATQANAAVQYTTSVGRGDAGPAADEQVVFDFDGPPPAGYGRVDGAPGSFGVFSGNTAHVAVAPYGDASSYFAVLRDGDESFMFKSGVSSASFYWGSIDDYNEVRVLGGTKADPVVLLDLWGADVMGGEKSKRIYFSTSGADIIGLELRSMSNGFELDDIAVHAPAEPPPVLSAAVPEPSCWALMLVGVGAIGATLRSHRRRTGRRPAALA